MPPARRRSPALALLTVLAALPLSACSADEPGTTITVTAGPDTCSASRDTADGPLTFWVLNVGEGDVAVSLVDSGGQVVAELDGIDPALWQIMAANVYDGDYTLVCRPPNGEGVSTDIAVG